MDDNIVTLLQDNINFKDFIATYYHQDVWDEYQDHIQVWNALFTENSREHLLSVLRAVVRLQVKNKKDFASIIDEVNSSGGLHFKDQIAMSDWLDDFANALRDALKT